MNINNGNGKHENISTQTLEKEPTTSTAEQTRSRNNVKFQQPVILKQSRFWSRSILWVLMTATTGTVIWANFTKIEEAVSAQGKLEPTGTVKEVQAPINGVVKEIYIKDGNSVKAGQTLLTLDPTTALSQLNSLQQIRASLIQENQFYNSLLRSEAVSPNSANLVKIPETMLILAKSRSTIAAENRLYRTQLNGSPNNTNNLSNEEQQRLQARLVELNSRLANIRLQAQQSQQKLRQNQVQLGNAIATLPITQESLVLNQKKLAVNQQGLGLDREKLLLDYSNLKISEDIAKTLEEITNEGAYPRLQLNKQQQEVIQQKQNVFTQQQQILQQKQQILQQQQQVLEQRSSVMNLESQAKQFIEEEKRLKLEIASAQAQLVNSAAVSKEDLLAKITNNDKSLAEMDTQITKAIIDNEKRISENDSQISQTQMNLKYQEIKAPTNGVIFELKANTSGFVVNNSDTIVKIVPEDALIAKVYITNKDIGFVKEGMTVDVRIDSFPFSEFGDIKGKLLWIGSDALPPDQIYPFYRFPVNVQLENQQLQVNGRKILLQSGMSVSTNIKIRERTVMSIFTDMFNNSIESLKTVR
jgi:hemolysin D